MGVRVEGVGGGGVKPNVKPNVALIKTGLIYDEKANTQIPLNHHNLIKRGVGSTYVSVHVEHILMGAIPRATGLLYLTLG